ncbi:DEAD/DEAH box helicase [Canibacter zhoujuaniae]|uniref:DEAD/DEAH box helicase n=1 Tax=Canibacter zhoujuaniae TaxID=2708343 RepID=UPI00141F9320|nr:DEAD/DEAH box helicase [Canibacter zhoujuaniae]
MAITETTADARDTVAAFQQRLGYQLDPFQTEACLRLAGGKSVLVAAPTGSGKTTVAEFAVALSRREHDLEIIYTSPIKALSNQKYRELCVTYGEDQVALLTGDVTVNPAAPIKVMTTEVLRNIIYADADSLNRLAFVVLDEVHYLGDPFRGAVWEEIILHLPLHVKIVALSATVSNVEELGDWINTVRGDTEVIISERRPVPLYQHVLTPDAFEPLYVHGRFNRALVHKLPAKRKRSRGAAPKKIRAIRHADIVRGLDETKLTPAIVFIFSRRGCDQAVTNCLYEGVSLTTRQEREEIRRVALAATADFSEAERRVLRIRTWIRGLERGIAAHHAGLLPQLKAVVELLFQQRLLKIVFATETLALGLNMPAKAVVLEKLVKFNGEDRVPLTSGEYTQLTGRAGRRGIDDEGHAVVVWHDGLDLEMLQGLAGNRSYPVKSSFKPTYNMAVNLLCTRTPDEVYKTLERSFAQFQADRAVVGNAAEIQKMRQSLTAYETAIAKAKTEAEAARWRDRAKKLRRRVSREQNRISGRVNSVPRRFKKVVRVLSELGYLTASERDDLQPNVWGHALTHIYGERSLLVAEAIRNGIWNELKPAELAALVGALTYEPRPNDWGDNYPLSPAFYAATDATERLWVRIDKLEEAAGLPEQSVPAVYKAWVMHAWAEKKPLEEILERSNLTPGDFLRWAKQTADLLGQIISACAAVDSDPAAPDMYALEVLAKQARGLVLYGIVESAGL